MGKRAKSKFYVVWVGRDPGVHGSWAECEAAVNGFAGARYKGFVTRDEAERAYREGASAHWGLGGGGGQKRARDAAPRDPDGRPREGLCVDAACNGAGGQVEYRGVLLPEEREVFKVGPLPTGTNNIGEFLALVHGLAYLQREASDLPVYSDSRVAIGWVRRRKSRSGWVEDGTAGAKLQELVRRAETWLSRHHYTTEIRKWETADWGEIPADFGRK